MGLRLPPWPGLALLLRERILADGRHRRGSLAAMGALAVALAGAHTAVRVAGRGRVCMGIIGRVALQRAGRLLLHHGAVALVVRPARDQ